MNLIGLTVLLLVQAQSLGTVQGGVVTGQVRTIDGAPVADVRIAAMAADTNMPGASALVSLGQTDASGRFRLENIPPGRYYITAGLIDSPTYYPGVRNLSQARLVEVTAGSTLPNVDFALMRPVGIKVSGRIAGIPDSAPPGLFKVALLSAAGAIGVIEAPVRPDGAFEFLKVPPGRYTVRTIPAAPIGGLPSIEAADKDITGLEIVASAILVGRVLTEDRSPLPHSMAVPPGLPDAPTFVRLQIQRSDGASNAMGSVRGDGYFVLPLSGPGEYQIATSQLPLGYSLKSISYGTADLLKAPLKFDGASTADLQVVLSIPAAAGSGVKVSGQVVNTSLNPAASAAWVSLSSLTTPGSSPIGIAETRAGETLIRPDKTFEFTQVPPGFYSVRVFSNNAMVAASTLSVADQDVAGVAVETRADNMLAAYTAAFASNSQASLISAGLEIPGRVSIDGGQAEIPANVSVSARGASMASGTSVGSNGAFRLHLQEGQYQITLSNLPIGYSVKSITYGSKDLLKDVLQVERSAASEIQVTLAAAPPESIRGVRVSGRVTNLPSSELIARINPAVRLQLGRGGPLVETPMNPDGTFAFSKVPPGVYLPAVTRIEMPGLSTLKPVQVGDQDIVGLIVELPRQCSVIAVVSAVDDAGNELPYVPLGVGLVYQIANGGRGGGGGIGSGPLKLLLLPGAYTITVRGMPADYTLKSLSSGSTDLLKSPLIVDDSMTPIDIQVTLEQRKRQ